MGGSRERGCQRWVRPRESWPILINQGRRVWCEGGVMRKRVRLEREKVEALLLESVLERSGNLKGKWWWWWWWFEMEERHVEHTDRKRRR